MPDSRFLYSIPMNLFVYPMIMLWTLGGIIIFPFLFTIWKMFFDHDFDSGNEHYLRVFEYDLINNEIGSSYETISDGEKHFIRFSIDIIYQLNALKEYNFTADKDKMLKMR